MPPRVGASLYNVGSTSVLAEKTSALPAVVVVAGMRYVSRNARVAGRVNRSDDLYIISYSKTSSAHTRITIQVSPDVSHTYLSP